MGLLIIPLFFSLLGLVKESSMITELDKSQSQKKGTLTPKTSYTSIGFNIYIDNTKVGSAWTDWTSYAWCSGSGSPSDPYVIDGIEVDVGGTGSCLIINNSNSHFEIRNSKFINSELVSTSGGIVLENTNNGKIIGTNCSDNAYHGILIWKDSDNNVIDNCFFQDNIYGVHIRDGSDDNEILNSVARKNDDGLWVGFGSVGGCINTLIWNNEIYDNIDDGVYLGQHCNGTIIDNNRIENNDGGLTSNYGISMITGSENVNITNNIIMGSDRGIFVRESNFLIIKDNEIKDNHNKGVDARNCNDILVAGNLINNHSEQGLLLDTSINATLSKNEVSNNDAPSEGGIHIIDGDNIIIVDNLIKDNREMGIYVEESSYLGEIDIVGNTLMNNKYYGIMVSNPQYANLLNNRIINSSVAGIQLSQVWFSTISYNNIGDCYACSDGIRIDSCDWTTISYNSINNTETGIEVDTSQFCLLSNNHIFNTSSFGIEIEDNYNKICDNNLTSSNYGVYINGYDYNTIDGNYISFCRDAGVYMENTISGYNQITNNYFTENDLGLELDGNAFHNTIEHNSFIMNNKTIWDAGSSNQVQLNYYDNYNGTDGDGDGIGDTHYSILGGVNSDPYPLVYNPIIIEEDDDGSSDGEETPDDEDDDGSSDDEETPDEENGGKDIISQPSDVGWIIGLVVVGVVSGFGGLGISYIILKKREDPRSVILKGKKEAKS